MERGKRRIQEQETGDGGEGGNQTPPEEVKILSGNVRAAGREWEEKIKKYERYDERRLRRGGGRGDARREVRREGIKDERKKRGEKRWERRESE